MVSGRKSKFRSGNYDIFVRKVDTVFSIIWEVETKFLMIEYFDVCHSLSCHMNIPMYSVKGQVG